MSKYTGWINIYKNIYLKQKRTTIFTVRKISTRMVNHKTAILAG